MGQSVGIGPKEERAFLIAVVLVKYLMITAVYNSAEQQAFPSHIIDTLTTRNQLQPRCLHS